MGGDAEVVDLRAAEPSRATKVIVVAGLVASAAAALAQVGSERVSGLTVVLALAACASGAVVVWQPRVSVTPSFIVVLLAAGFLGPVSAWIACLPAELIAGRRTGTGRWPAAVNLVGATVPALLAADIVRWLAPPDRRGLGFYVVLAAAGLGMLFVNFPIVAFFASRFGRERPTRRLFWEYMPTQALNIALPVAGAAIYVEVGLPGIVFALAALVTFGYMGQLLERARRQATRAQEQAELAEKRADENLALSYGVLSGLVYALDLRDHRAARHAVAVARFASDIAAEVGLPAREQELVHTAGLLHDIGQIVFYDHIHETGRELVEDDWERIQGHPEVGEELLRNLGGYGPVAEIVRSHHERIDGMGYPDNLIGEEIPVLSRIIAVAEAYDTLTSPDTYRAVTMSPLQALNELRRHAGTQFDGAYVDALSRALGDKAFDDHVVKEADFDAELDLERRIRESRLRRRDEPVPPAAAR